jgi:CO/xanthine dehydrogenase Mo-binding subunit
MDFYDESVVAGEGDFVFTRTLLELANHVGIPPPEFHGKTEYREMGLEKWTILTKILLIRHSFWINGLVGLLLSCHY